MDIVHWRHENAVVPSTSSKLGSSRKEKIMIGKLGRIALLLALVVSLAAGSAHAQNVLTHQTRAAVKDGTARLVGHMPANQVINLVLVLPLRNQDGLNQFLNDVYDPASPNYRHFLTL